MTLNLTIVAVYLVGMLAFGWWGKTRAASSEDYLVAGRRLGPVLFTGTMAAVVLGGAATVGGVGLGYEFGLSGAWLVAAIGVGVLILSVAFAPILARLKIYTVSQMLRLRYGRGGASHASSFVMLAYTLMLAATSTGAYASLFVVLFGWDRWLSVLVGGGIVLAYSVLGGMWSITLADMAQFLIMTIGLFALMLPLSLANAGGWSAMQERLGAEFFSWDGIGVQSIVTYFVIYTLGLLIGQDVWQRVFTARSPRVAQIGGATAGLYCIVYGVAGAVIGMAARTVTADIATQVHRVRHPRGRPVRRDRRRPRVEARHRHGGPVVHGGRDGGHPRHHGLARAERGRALRGRLRERADLRRPGRLRRRVRPPQPDDPAHRPRGPRGLAGALPPRRRPRGPSAGLTHAPGACDPPTPARWPRPRGAAGGGGRPFPRAPPGP